MSIIFIELGDKRDYSLDFFKGVTVISIVFIHTVWWSGQSYVPNYIAQLSLLVDVPLFFFLSGASATFSFEKPKPFSGIIRLVSLFTLFYLVYGLIHDTKNTFDITISSLFLVYTETSRSVVVSGSSWFIPVFVIVYLIAYFIVSYLGKNKVILYLCGLLLFFMYQYESIKVFKSLHILSLTPDFVIANLFFFLLGYYYYRVVKKTKKVQLFSGFLLIISVIITVYHFMDIPFNLQNIKFPHRFYYVIVSLISISLCMMFSSLIKKEYFVNFIGKNSLQFYLAQGISSSFMFKVASQIKIDWFYKLPVVFLLNLLITYLVAKGVIFIFKHYLKFVSIFFSYIDSWSPPFLKK